MENLAQCEFFWTVEAMGVSAIIQHNGTIRIRMPPHRIGRVDVRMQSVMATVLSSPSVFPPWVFLV